MPHGPGRPARSQLAARLGAFAVGLLLLWPLAAIEPAAAQPERPARRGPSHASQRAFMWAMAGQESGWDWFARNGSSGAFGRYQIMPFNWPSWAEIYLGDAHADQTPANQQRVAWGKLRDLHGWLGSWRRVAYWWLTGSSEPNRRRWSAYARGYVRNIMALRRRAPAHGGLPHGPTAGSWLDRGDWRRAEESLRLRGSPRGRTWRHDGGLHGGQVVRIRTTREARDGLLWLRVVTIDGRIGWVKAVRTVPTHQPVRPARWSDVRDDGRGRMEPPRGRHGRGQGDRSRARPRAR